MQKMRFQTNLVYDVRMYVVVVIVRKYDSSHNS